MEKIRVLQMANVRLASAFGFCLASGISLATPVSSLPDWELLAVATSGDSTWFHRDSVERTSLGIHVWVVQNYTAPLSELGKVVKSKRFRFTLDCPSKKLSSALNAAFSGPDGDGEILFTGPANSEDGPFRAIAPGSVGEEFLNKFCKVTPTQVPSTAKRSAQITKSDAKEFAALDRSYPAWFEHGESQPFKIWLKSQPRATQSRFENAQTAEQVLSVLNEHRISLGLEPLRLVR